MKFHFVPRKSKEAASGDSKELPCWMKPEALTNYNDPSDSLIPGWNRQEVTVPVTRKFTPTASGQHGLQKPRPRWNLELGVGKKVIPKSLKEPEKINENPARGRCPVSFWTRFYILLRGIRMTETQQLIVVIHFCW